MPVTVPAIVAVLLLLLAYYADEVAAGFAGLLWALRDLLRRG